MTSTVTDQERAAAEALTAIPAMLREIRAVMYLEESDPRYQAAMSEKQRVLGLIERSKRAS